MLLSNTRKIKEIVLGAQTQESSNGREVVSMQEAQNLTGTKERTIQEWLIRGRVERASAPRSPILIYKDSLCVGDGLETGRRLFRTSELARLMEMSRFVVSSLCDNGILEYITTPGGIRKIFIDSVFMCGDPGERKVVSIPSACKISGYCRSTVVALVRKNKVEYTYTVNGRVRIFLDSLLKYKQERKR